MELTETKYDPLYDHLLYSGKGEVKMTFSEVERVLGKPLPASAYKRKEWWSNNETGHVQAKAWLNASYRTARIDLEQQTVDFVLKGWPEGFEEVGTRFGQGVEPTSESASQSVRHPAWGALKGMITVQPGVDLTKPAFEDWEELYGERD